MKEPFFITTAIDYTNGAPHIGHAYEKVFADVLARFQRQVGRDVFFLTGVDQHGQKVQQSAEKAGVSPQEYVDQVTAKFRALWEKLGVRYDGWAATTDALHKECVRANLQILWDDKVPGTDRSRWIYKKTQRGFYSVRQEQFLTDKERGADGEFGPEWQPVEEREEENFYFRLIAHPDLGFDPKQWLLDFIDRRSQESRPFVVPEFRVAELRNAIEKLEGDLCISRPASRLQWGIPFPESFGEGFVTYVWFDALVNYITYAPGHDPHYSERAGTATEFTRFWPPLHVIGKDIMIPAHGVYWPIMLKALGFTDEEMPTLLVHGWWNIRSKGGESEKMSKSLGNVVDPDVLADKYGTAAVRYYLMSDIATGRDADFSEERLIQRYNVDLANGLGNLVNRSLSMTRKYREGRPNPPSSSAELTEDPYFSDDLLNYESELRQSIGDYIESMNEAKIQAGLESMVKIVNQANALVDSSAPWKLAKNSEQAERLDAVLTTLIFSAQAVATMLLPVVPEVATEILRQINLPPLELNAEVTASLPEDYCCGEPKPVFPRLELPTADAV